MLKSVRVIGWSTIFFSVIIIITNIFSLLSDPMDQFKILLQMFPQILSSMNSITDLFLYNRIWSIYTILYFLFVLIGAIQFVRFNKIGRTILETACWIGMINACMDSILSYILLKNMQAMLSSALGNMGTGLGILNPLGLITIILGFFLWVIPSIGMIFYLRKSQLKSLMK